MFVIHCTSPVFYLCASTVYCKKDEGASDVRKVLNLPPLSTILQPLCCCSDHYLQYWSHKSGLVYKKSARRSFGLLLLPCSSGKEKKEQIRKRAKGISSQTTTRKLMSLTWFRSLGVSFMDGDMQLIESLLCCFHLASADSGYLFPVAITKRNLLQRFVAVLGYIPCLQLLSSSSSLSTDALEWPFISGLTRSPCNAQ